MNPWLEQSMKSLLPLSENRSSFAEALTEWYYTGCCNDLEEAVGECGLCGFSPIRYQFQIHNEHTRHTLLVGSECITKFGISAVDDEGNVLGFHETEQLVTKHRGKMIADAKRKRMILALIQLGTVVREFNIDNFITYFQDRGAFTPSQLALLLWQLDKHRIKYSPTDFSMTIRRDREKTQLRGMEDWKRKRLYQSMSLSQRQWCIRNGLSFS